MERWAEYVEELYKDESRKEGGMDELVNEVTIISREEKEMMRLVELTTFVLNCYKTWMRREWK